MNLIGYKKSQMGFLQFSLDAVMITTSFLLACLLKRTVLFSDPYLDSTGYLKLYLIALPFLMGTLYFSKLYSLSVMLLPWKKWLTKVARSVLSMFAVFIVLSFYLKVFSYSRLVFTLFLILVFPSLMLSKFICNSTSIKPWLRRNELYYNIVYFTDRKEEGLRRDLRDHFGCSLQEVQLSDGTELSASELERINQGKIGGAFIDLDEGRTGETAAILKRANQEGVSAFVSPRTAYASPGSVHLNDYKLSVEELWSQTIVAFNPNQIPAIGSVLKRVLDVVLSSILLVFLGPFMVFIAAAIRATSAGPAIYTQTRVGFGGRLFTLYKFRSMRVDAETETGPVWAARDDGRVTKVGRFIRRTFLDELPQLFNVMAGDMSLVGPRPERPEFVAGFKRKIGRYSHKHWVKPGITGWAQINGWRGNTNIRERIKHDLFYIENWSLWIDLKILVWTPFKAYRNDI